MNDEVKKAAEEYALTIWSKELATYDEKQDCANAFLAGAEYGFARAVKLLRSDECNGKHFTCHGPMGRTTWGTELAKWLEEQNRGDITPKEGA